MRVIRCALPILAACGAACGNSSSKITVAGKLVPPVAGAHVVIAGQAATPDASTGAFSIGGVTPPYDLLVLMPAAQKSAVLYKGLRRADPTIRMSSSEPYSAKISGTVTGGQAPPLPVTQTHVTFGAPGLRADAAAVVGQAITYDMTPKWSSGASITGTLHALQWNRTGPADPRPAVYTGYFEKAGVTIADGGTFAGQDLALAPVAGTSHVTGTVTVPSGYGPNVSSDLDLVYADGSTVFVVEQLTAPAGAFDYLVPSIPGATVSIAARAPLASGAMTMSIRPSVPLDASGVAIALQTAPEALAPAAAATGVTTSTVFSWKPFANGVHTADFGGGAAQPRFQVVTTDASTTIPDLSLYGLELPKNAAYFWMVEGLAPFASVDDVASATSILSGGALPQGATFSMGVSEARAFTTAQ